MEGTRAVAEEDFFKVGVGREEYVRPPLQGTGAPVYTRVSIFENICDIEKKSFESFSARVDVKFTHRYDYGAATPYDLVCAFLHIKISELTLLLANKVRQGSRTSYLAGGNAELFHRGYVLLILFAYVSKVLDSLLITLGCPVCPTVDWL